METFTMSRKEVPRAGLVKAALEGKITNAEGARALRISVRQFTRLKVRLKAEGVRGLLHRSRGRPSSRRLAPAVAEQIEALMTTVYAGFNDAHLTEKLQEQHSLPISRTTVRRVRVALGRPAHRRRRAPKHRRRRPRVPAMGQLVQLDASPFDWLEDRGPRATLHGLIDDATSHPLALWFEPHEDLHGYLTVLDQTCRRFGLPVTLYGDRLNVFVRNDPHWSLDEQLTGQRDHTHFGRVLADRLRQNRERGDEHRPRPQAHQQEMARVDEHLGRQHPVHSRVRRRASAAGKNADAGDGASQAHTANRL